MPPVLGRVVSDRGILVILNFASQVEGHDKKADGKAPPKRWSEKAHPGSRMKKRRLANHKQVKHDSFVAEADIVRAALDVLAVGGRGVHVLAADRVVAEAPELPSRPRSLICNVGPNHRPTSGRRETCDS